MKQAFINTEFVPEKQALLHFQDLAIMRGYGIFEFFRLKGENPLFLEDHLTRFYESAEHMRLPLRFERQHLRKIIYNLIHSNKLPDTGIRITLTGGYSEDGYSIAQPNLVISQHLFIPPTKEQQRTGIRLMSFPHQRQLPHVKTIDYLMPIWLQPLIKQSNVDDVLYYQKDFITECPRNNFFIITEDERILTPAENMLKGITRMKVLHYAAPYFPLEECNITLEDIQRAKEAFVTSTTRGILPVAQVDDRIYSSFNITNKLQEIWERHVPGY
ncbi:MAG: aminotransferase class IV [Candidatus Dadabacteria bacterium]